MTGSFVCMYIEIESFSFHINPRQTQREVQSLQVNTEILQMLLILLLGKLSIIAPYMYDARRHANPFNTKYYRT